MSRLVIIDRRLSLPEAAVRASMLAAYRIPVVVGGSEHAGMHWYVLFALGGVAIQVPEDLRETAEVLLRPLEPAMDLSESQRFWRQPLRNGLGAALVCFGLPLPFWLRSREEEETPS